MSDRCDCKDWGCSCECCRPATRLERVTELVRAWWYEKTDFARFHDGVPGAGLYANRCTIPLKFLPKASAIVYAIRGRYTCGAYEGGSHRGGHTYWPGQWRSVPHVDGAYAPDESAEHAIGVAEDVETRMANEIAELEANVARIRAKIASGE